MGKNTTSITRSLQEFSKDNLMIYDITEKKFYINGNIVRKISDSKDEEIVFSAEETFSLLRSSKENDLEETFEKLMKAKKISI